MRVFVQGGAATPLTLLDAINARRADFRSLEFTGISTYGGHLFENPYFGDHFYFNSLFVSDNIRRLVNSGAGDYVPIFLSEIPSLFGQGILPLDVALVHVSAPDKHGYCSLGTSVDIARSAIDNARYIIAQVNPNMPRTHGDGMVHLSAFHAIVEVNDPLPESVPAAPGAISRKIGAHCAALIEDRSTLQMGIGNIPDAVLSFLGNHKDLGVHTEMFSDGLIPLLEKGVVNNKFKKKHRGKTVTSFALGSRRLYNFVDDNPTINFLDISYVNDPGVIRANPKVVSINSAIEVDLTGQVCADSIGSMQYSGVGGQVDFMRGATLSEGGKPIIAISSTTATGQSKIVPFLKQGAGVVTSRAHVHYIVTEYGVADLFGKNLYQRACEMIKIAHPDHREDIEKEIFSRFGKTPGLISPHAGSITPIVMQHGPGPEIEPPSTPEIQPAEEPEVKPIPPAEPPYTPNPDVPPETEPPTIVPDLPGVGSFY